jgi:hypothetical protein
MDYFGFQCSDYCQICRMVDQPKCIEDFEDNLLHFWDFAPFRWYRPIWDYGKMAARIPLLTVNMTDQGLFTHHNGMWFDEFRWLNATAQWNMFSFSIDVWFKFQDAVQGTLIQRIGIFPSLFKLYFVDPNLVYFSVNENNINNTFTFNKATDYNKWMIVQASVNKQEK